VSATTTIAICLSLVTADPEVGDKVVTLTTAPVMSGSEKLAEIEPGAELTITGVKLPWVGVAVTQDGKAVKGWVLDKNLIPKPAEALKRLAARGNVKAPDDLFKKIDADNDLRLTRREFELGTRPQTLEDLNEQLRLALEGQARQFAAQGTPQTPFARRMTILFALRGGTTQVTFDNWKTPLTKQNVETLCDDYLRTQDMRQSRSARELIDAERPEERAERAGALFIWADTNRDNALSIQEFQRATGIVSPSNARTNQKEAPDSGKPERAVAEGDVLRLIEELEGENVSFQIRAAKELKEMGREGRNAVPALARVLQHDNGTLRISAAKALESMGQDAKDAVPALVNALQDENGTVRIHAAKALGSIGSDAKAAVPALTRDAVPALINAITDGRLSVKRYAMEALGNIGPGAKVAVPALVQALTDESGLLRRYAVRALGDIGPDAKAAVPALTNLLDDRSLKYEAEKALKKIGTAP